MQNQKHGVGRGDVLLVMLAREASMPKNVKLIITIYETNMPKPTKNKEINCCCISHSQGISPC